MRSESSLGAIGRELVARDLCSLSPEELEQRLALVRSEIQPLVIAHAELPDGVAWEFEADIETRERLERLAELERECCNVGLAFQVQEDRPARRLRFEIRGAAADAFRALAGGGSAVVAPAPESGGWRRLAKATAKATGMGAAGSLFVCCVIPIGVGAIAGASIAAPLLKLDHPAVIAAVAAVFGAGTWWVQRRRDGARAAQARAPELPQSGCGCRRGGRATPDGLP